MDHLGSSGGSSGLVRFGSFEANLTTGELWRDGFRVKVQDQPFRILAMLLKRPGEVVTREELRNAIWSSDTFVEFDDSVNTSINKLRRALNDSADRPRYIETVPRRGYRFVWPVESVAPAQPGRNLLPIALLTTGAVAVALLLWLLMAGASPYLSPFLTPLKSGASLTFRPVLSPDGNYVAYSSIGGGDRDFDVWLQRIGGGPPVRLTEHPAQDYSPAFSPDGSQVAFLSTRDGGGVYAVSPLGGEPRLLQAETRLLFVAGESASRVRFSPDGQSLFYDTKAPQPAIWMLRLSGGQPREMRPDDFPGNAVWCAEPSRVMASLHPPGGWEPDVEHRRPAYTRLRFGALSEPPVHEEE